MTHRCLFMSVFVPPCPIRRGQQLGPPRGATCHPCLSPKVRDPPRPKSWGRHVPDILPKRMCIPTEVERFPERDPEHRKGTQLG